MITGCLMSGACNEEGQYCNGISIKTVHAPLQPSIRTHNFSSKSTPSSTPSTSSNMAQLIPSTTPVRAFENHGGSVSGVAVFPDGRRMVTGSYDTTLRLCDLNTGVVLKKMMGHRGEVWGLAVSRDGQLIASGDNKGELTTWHGETGEFLTQAIQAHSNAIHWVDFSPDGAVLATGSYDCTTKLWCTKTWQLQGNPITCGGYVFCVQYSPSGKLLAIATVNNIQIYHPGTRECVANFKAHTSSTFSLAWTPDGTRLLSGGCQDDSTIREWDTSTWKQVGDLWKGHTSLVYAIAIHPAGALVASASFDNYVRLWCRSDRQTIAIFKHSSDVHCITFSIDGRHILSGGVDKKISEWLVPEDALPQDCPKEETTYQAQDTDFKILVISATARDACITGDLPTAEELLTKEIDADDKNYNSYANRSFIMARKLDWDHALCDAIKSVSIQPSLIGYIAKVIALCGKQQVQDAVKAFDVAFAFTHADPKTTHFLFLIKAIALFNAHNQEEAVLPVQELAAHPNADPLATRVVEAYLRVQLGTSAMDAALHDEAADHFTTAVNAGASFAQSDIHSMYEDFVVLFGWNLKSLWQTANQKRCQALLRAGQFGEAFEAYRYMMEMSDEPTKAIFLAWIPALNEARSIC
ncbi:WD40-repeat-containing domain protein [Suillus paluster]|uniref:WD40-repeat-containing domain protein n=1 Tax=Suillus paluster TaxID=48578 RepID=UPI001B870DB0|nr:WD40-repeat-containing domain protein [Suillus paluster]KAG1752319.1 WD40-repeat-containing domain protein [Suillus paluster]